MRLSSLLFTETASFRTERRLTAYTKGNIKEFDTDLPKCCQHRSLGTYFSTQKSGTNIPLPCANVPYLR